MNDVVYDMVSVRDLGVTVDSELSYCSTMSTKFNCPDFFHIS